MGLAVGNVPGEGARAGYRDQGVGRAVPEKGWHRIGCKIQPPCVADQHQVAVRAVAATAEAFLELEVGAGHVLEIGRQSGGERLCHDVLNWVDAGSLKKLT